MKFEPIVSTAILGAVFFPSGVVAGRYVVNLDARVCCLHAEDGS